MTNKSNFFFSLILTMSLLLTQIGGVLAAPILPRQSTVGGMIQSITLESDTVTGVTLVSIDLMDANQVLQTIRVSLETAIAQGFVVLDEDGKPNINNAALGKSVEIDPSSIIPTRQETEHPVGSALATFFADIAGMDYETIMTAHEQGVGFGVIAQTLWLTTKLDGDSEIFEAMIEAKQTGDFSTFVLEDGSSPENWGQLRNAILDKDEKNSVGVVISDSAHNNSQGNNGNGNGNDNGNGNMSDKDKDKEKDKNKGRDKDKGPDKDKKK
ncbi:MAG TPA: hypothetical protein VJ830_09830 [Anaerolineales bacterium]|nr:hypothetical protein [Anaerolineales bacterium]